MTRIPVLYTRITESVKFPNAFDQTFGEHKQKSAKVK